MNTCGSTAGGADPCLILNLILRASSSSLLVYFCRVKLEDHDNTLFKKKKLATVPTSIIIIIIIINIIIEHSAVFNIYIY